MTLPIRHEWTDAGAPVLNNAAGSVCAVLKAVLETGYNVQAITDITVAAGVATVTHAGSHGYTAQAAKLVLISGAPVPALNGNQQPLAVAGTTWTFAAPGVADGTYTGAMEARRAPLGWTELHRNGAGTSMIFGRSTPEATILLLRVNDSGADGASTTNARVVMIESATDIDTYSGESPTSANVAGGLYWYRGANNATAKPWALVGDGLFFYFIHPTTDAAPYNVQISYFGDPIPYVTPAPWDCMICGSTHTGTTGLRGGSVFNFQTISQSFGEVLARDLAGATRGVYAGKHAPGASLMGSANAGFGGASPIVVHAPVCYSRVDVVGEGLRGEMPGLAAPLARVPFTSLGQFSELVVDDVTYLVVLFTIGSAQNGNALIELSRPWRPA
jgi:hypothetical protein